MKIISTISDTLGYTLDTYSTFNAADQIADDDWQEGTEAKGWQDATEFDHDNFVKELAAHQIEVLNGYTDNIVKEFMLEGAYSPREYNFKTDNSELAVKFNATRLMAYINRNQKAFDDYLRDNFTSYDGFWSYVPNNWREFTRELRGADKIASDRNWAIMLGWYMRHSETLTTDEYLEDMYEGLSEIAYNNAKNLAEVDC